MQKRLSFSALAIATFIGAVAWSCSSISGGELPEALAKIADQVPEEIDYNIHVKPIISDRCFKCHGPDKNKIEAGLQLTNFEGANEKLKSGKRALVPGNVDDSELIKRILSHDPEEIMPTPESNLALTDVEKAILIRWVQQGGEYKEHWAFSAIEKPSVPKVGTFWSRLGFGSNPETDWVKNDIDAFTLNNAKKMKLGMSKEADKATLLRRVTMDLTGLPPTIQELDAFMKDNAANAYEKVVDRLLKSPHYGEHQAVSWLDLARYADTQGYQDDGMRNAFPYRDWVIKAFNTNLPFDQFTKFQLAGDLMPNPTTDMLVATSFNRQHQQSQEGGIIPEEYQTEYVADRVNTFGKAFLGLTTECSRCHDHKYDPISAKDYYSLYAFFNTNHEFGEIPYNGEPSPHITLPSDSSAKKLAEIKTFLGKLKPKANDVGFEKWLATARKNPTAALVPDSSKKYFDVAFEGIESKKVWKEKKIPADPAKKTKERIEKYQADEHKVINTAQANNNLTVNGDKEIWPVLIKGIRKNAFFFKGESFLEAYNGVNYYSDYTKAKDFEKSAFFERYDSFTISSWFNIQDKKTKGSIINRNSSIMNGFRGWDVVREENGTLRFRFSYVWPANAIDVVTTKPAPFKRWFNYTVTHDGSSSAKGVRVFIDGVEQAVKIDGDNLTQSTVHGKKKSWWGAGTMQLAIARWHDQETKNYGIDELKIYGRELSTIEVQTLVSGKNKLAELLAKTALSDQEKASLQAYYSLNFDPEGQKFLAERKKLLKQETDILIDEKIDVAIMREAPQPRKSYFLNRGVYDSPGEEVTPITPVKFGKFKYTQNRLGLAEWLLDEENPLFARVMVNRFWQNFFGNGLVKTQEDFGNQGDMPSNPALLDWLAVEFRSMNWDVKAFQKMIVMSATYRQSSTASAEMLERDPDNKTLTRGPSSRLTAEQVRDNALAASGLLVRKVGGPSVYPYQPAGIWEALATRNEVTYKQNHGDSLYRRSMYTIWKRSSPHPMMLNFDAAERHTCVVRRQKTATPLQALVTMNDPQFVEAAKVLAYNALKTNNSQIDRTIETIFKASLSRNPRPNELALMKELYTLEYEEFGKDKSRIEYLMKVGEKQIQLNEGLQQLAAMTVVTNTILNHDEAIVKR